MYISVLVGRLETFNGSDMDMKLWRHLLKVELKATRSCEDGSGYIGSVLCVPWMNIPRVRKVKRATWTIENAE
jgi:hypothetical protein